VSETAEIVLSSSCLDRIGTTRWPMWIHRRRTVAPGPIEARHEPHSVAVTLYSDRVSRELSIFGVMGRIEKLGSTDHQW